MLVQALRTVLARGNREIMKRNRFGIVAGLVALASVAPAQSILTFQRDHSASATAYDAANDVAVDAQGNIVTVGHTTDSLGNRDIFVSKQDRLGNLLWKRAYKGNGNGFDSASAVTVGGDGSIYLAAEIDDDISSVQTDIATIKYSPEGILQWVAKYNGPASQYDRPIDIALDRDGNVVVAGNTEADGAGYTGRDFVTLKYGPTGALAWANVYNGPGSGYDTLAGLAVGPDGTVAVLGHAFVDGTKYYDIATVAYAPDGTQKWVALQNEVPYDTAKGISIDPQGNVLVLGQARDPYNASDYLVLRYAPTGTLDWRWTYRARESEAPDIPNDIKTDREGNVYVTGYSMATFEKGLECTTIKLDPTSAILWINRYDGGNGSSPDYGVKLALDANRNVFVLGEGSVPYGSSFQRDLFALRINSDGTFGSVKTFGGPNANIDYARGLAVDLRGNMAIASTSMNGNYGTLNSASVGQITVRNDAYSLPEDNVITTSVPTGLLANDTSTSAVFPPVTLVVGPSHGTLSLGTGGNFTYTPHANYNGPDSFTYRLANGTFQSDVATVSLTVTPVPDTPVAVSDTFGGAGNQAATIPVLANDSDPDGDPLRVFAVTSAGKGLVSINADGTIRYVPNLWSGGTDSFSYYITDETASTYANVGVTIYAADASGEVSVVTTAPKLNRKTGAYESTVTLTNTGGRSIPGLKLLLANLAGASLLDTANRSVFWTPGSPYLSVDSGRDGVLTPGERVKLTLRFSGPSPTYSAKPLAGAGQP